MELQEILDMKLGDFLAYPNVDDTLLEEKEIAFKQKLTFGQQAVGLMFNPSKMVSVDLAKLLAARLIDLNEEAYSERLQQNLSTDKDGIGRNVPLSWNTNVLRTAAFNAIIAAQMALVKILTWKD